MSTVKSTKSKSQCNKNKSPVTTPTLVEPQQQSAPIAATAPAQPSLVPPPPPPPPSQLPSKDLLPPLAPPPPQSPSPKIKDLAPDFLPTNKSTPSSNNLKIVIKKEPDDGSNCSVSSTPNTTPAGTQPKSTKKQSSSLANSSALSNSRDHIHDYLHEVSGQRTEKTIQEKEHDYCKPWHTHPDPQVRSRSAKFLFMKYFPRHLSKQKYTQNSDNEIIDVIHPFEEQKKIPFLTPKPQAIPILVDEDHPEIDPMITDQWSCEMNKLWTKATKIIYADRTSRLSFEGNLNEVLLKRNLQEQTANKFRELFASIFWDFKLVNWLHNTLQEFLDPNYKSVYLDSLQILRHKIPSLIETFYPVPKTENKIKLPSLNDPLFNTLSHYKPKKLSRKPIIIMVPVTPNFVVSESPRMKYWHSMFSSMGKLVTIPISAKPNDFVSDILNDIRCLVNEKIRNCKSQFASRPIIVVGFNHGSLIAVSCSLENQNLVSATICLGFPLKGINGIRGELDDPFLETTVPIQFVIGENAIMTSLDDIEDFRERMTKTETALVVVGGADDRLIVSNTKKRLELLTQSLVDRCVVDEIYNFLSDILSSYKDGIIGQIVMDGSQGDHRFTQDMLANLVSLQKTTDLSVTPTPVKKKKVSRKRLLENGELANCETLNSDSTTPAKPAYKRKRPPKRPKPTANDGTVNTPLPPTTPSNTPLGFVNQNLNPSSLPVSFATNMQQTFPNLTSVLNNFTPEKSTSSSYFDFSSIKDIDKSKIVSQDNNKQPITFSLQTPKTAKKSTKKKSTVNNSNINNSVNSNINLNHFSSVNGEQKNFVGLIRSMESNNQMALTEQLKLTLGLPSSNAAAATNSHIFSTSAPPITSNSALYAVAISTASPQLSTHLSSTLSTSISTSSKRPTISIDSRAISANHHFVSSTTTTTTTSASTTTTTTTTATNPTHTTKDSYTLSEITGLLHQSATRTGRPIKPPKALDI